MKTLKLAYSPCPNDTFLFAGLAMGSVKGRLAFDISLHDIEGLNQMASQARADLIKTSFFNYPQVQDQYEIMDTGSALGFGTGPLLISSDGKMPNNDWAAPVAIPGRNTTANLLLSMALPELANKKEYLFSGIVQAIRDQEVQAGAIIHETRFTYKAHGLKLTMDLGRWWEKHTGLPVPLGGLAIRRGLPTDVKQEADRMLKESLKWARQAPGQTWAYTRAHAQEMETRVMQEHIKLYVNDYTYSLGNEGRGAIRRMLDAAAGKALAGTCRKDIFAPTRIRP
jgi:1,4-dihydroxy-6-naphthoate synthase